MRAAVGRHARRAPAAQSGEREDAVNETRHGAERAHDARRRDEFAGIRRRDRKNDTRPGHRKLLIAPASNVSTGCRSGRPLPPSFRVARSLLCRIVSQPSTGSVNHAPLLELDGNAARAEQTRLRHGAPFGDGRSARPGAPSRTLSFRLGDRSRIAHGRMDGNR